MNKFLLYVAVISFGSLVFVGDQTATIVDNIIQSEQPKPPAEQIKKIDHWQITKSPRPNIPEKKINEALKRYQELGLSKEGASYLVGNFLQEKPSAFITGDPCAGKLGDGGKAHGFGQWHPGRRKDMPCGFNEQLTWAFDIEMQRDTPQLKKSLRENDKTEIRKNIKQWERYGFEGNRFYYGEKIFEQIK